MDPLLSAVSPSQTFTTPTDAAYNAKSRLTMSATQQEETSSMASPSLREFPFPTPSCSSPDEMCIHTRLPPVALYPVCEHDTLDLFCSICYITWPGRSRKNKHASCDPQGLGPSHAHSHAGGKSTAYTQHRRWNKIGTAFQRCLLEMEQFVGWDDKDLRVKCLSATSCWNSKVNDKLETFGYYTDVTGKVHSELNPKPSSSTSKSVHAHGHSHNHADSKKPLQIEPDKSKRTGPQKTQACSQTPHPKTDPNCAQKLSKNAATTPNQKPGQTSRQQQKAPQQIFDRALLNDCRRFASLSESNTENRTVLSISSTLSKVMTTLNQAVLAFMTHSPDNIGNPIYTEFIGLVALLNYAAATYWLNAQYLEAALQDDFSKDLINKIFYLIYSDHAVLIETEEKCPDDGPVSASGADAKKRDGRRTEIENEFSRIVPDYVELRDGVQTILFTFIWINETALKDRDQASKSTLHILIPLVETIVIRCARQSSYMSDLLGARYAIHTIDTPLAPTYLELQIHLLRLGAALQSFSGSDVPLFTSGIYGGAPRKAKRGKKIGWTEGVAACPYSAHMYTAAFAIATYDMLNKMIQASDGGNMTSEPEKKKHPKGCTCEQEAEERSLTEIDFLGRRLTLLERRQWDWKPLMVKGGKSKKNKKKRKKAAQSQTEGLEDLHFEDILEVATGDAVVMGVTDQEDELCKQQNGAKAKGGVASQPLAEAKMPVPTTTAAQSSVPATLAKGTKGMTKSKAESIASYCRTWSIGPPAAPAQSTPSSTCSSSSSVNPSSSSTGKCSTAASTYSSSPDVGSASTSNFIPDTRPFGIPPPPPGTKLEPMPGFDGASFMTWGDASPSSIRASGHRPPPPYVPADIQSMLDMMTAHGYTGSDDGISVELTKPEVLEAWNEALQRQMKEGVRLKLKSTNVRVREVGMVDERQTMTLGSYIQGLKEFVGGGKGNGRSK